MSIVQQFVVTRPSNYKYRYVTLQLLGDECNLKNGKKNGIVHILIYPLPTGLIMIREGFNKKNRII